MNMCERKVKANEINRYKAFYYLKKTYFNILLRNIINLCYLFYKVLFVYLTYKIKIIYIFKYLSY